MTKPTIDVAAASRRASASLRAGRFAEAQAIARELTAHRPDDPAGWLLLGRSQLGQGAGEAALASAREAARCDPGFAGARILSVEALMQLGRGREALSDVRALEKFAWNDARMLQTVGQFYTHLSRHQEAARVYGRAVELAPSNPQCIYNLSTAKIALGELEQAESLLDKTIALAPHDYDAYYNRATLRRQTAARNHVVEIESVLAAPLKTPGGEVQLCYALAKELEDLGSFERAFAYLKRGADRRRMMLSYSVASDVETMAQIAAAFGRETTAKAPPAQGAPGPIFITGLPRSGTTLVDRILSSHSAVSSLGEVTDFALALMQTCGAGTKADLIARSARMDFGALGRAYLERTAAYGRSEGALIDKTPLNFLYFGLIALALPNARIVHLRRNAMDVCFAMYKTLFRMGYPFSYDLRDLSAYVIAHEKLMAHWRSVMPERFLEVSYEDIVRDQEALSRQVVAHCGLAWEDACLAFERNESASLTASAAQVRQPIYASSIDLWRRYERELAPLAAMLQAGGIDIGDGR